MLCSKVIPIVCENLTYNTQYKIEINKPRVYTSVVPWVKIKADKLSIQSKDNGEKLSINDLSIKLRILPLFSGRLHINNLSSSFLEFDKTLESKIKIDEDVLKRIKNNRLICNSVNISNLRILLREQNENNSAVIVAKDIKYNSNGRYLKFNIDSSIKINEKESKAALSLYLPKDNNIAKSNIDVQISDFDVSVLNNYLKDFLPKDIMNVSGIVNFSACKKHLSANIKNFQILNNDKPKSIIFPKELCISSGLNITRKTLALDNAEIRAKNINAAFDGFVSNYADKKRSEINFNIRVNKSRIEDFVEMLPAIQTEDIDVYKLKKYKFYGDIIGNLSIKGDVTEPSMIGSLFIDNGVLTRPIPNAKGATVKLDFKGKYLNYDVVVPAGNNQKVWVKGGVELYNVKYADMRVWSTPSVNLEIAEEKVVPIHEILNFVIGPVPIMDIKGIGNINITVKGNRKTPHVWGALNFSNVRTKFYEIPNLILTDAEAVLRFDDESAYFNLKRGNINGKSVNIDGACSLNGKFDFDVKANGQNASNMYKAIQTASMIDEVKNMFPKDLSELKGNLNLKLNVYGSIKDINEIKFKENFFVKGNIELLNNAAVLNKIRINNLKGIVNFSNTNADADITSDIGKSPISVKCSIKDRYIDASVASNAFNLVDVMQNEDKSIQDLANVIINIAAKYKGNIDTIEYNNLDLLAIVVGNKKDSKIAVSSGKISLKNGSLSIEKLIGEYINTHSKFNINMSADSIFSKPILNGNVNLSNFDLTILNMYSKLSIIPEKYRDLIQTIQFDKGKVNISGNISNNNVNASLNIGGIEFTYIPKGMKLSIPMKVINGSIYLKRHYLGLNKINIIAENMPLLIDGGINNIFTKRDFNLYINSKPKQEFIDKYFNNNHIYPLKVKGDIVYWIKLQGVNDNYNIKSEAYMTKESSIYYLGATIGDIENSIVLNTDVNVIKNNLLKIREFSYDKLINSQWNKQTRLNMLKVGGDVDISKADIEFKDLKVKTNNPTDAKIFNIMFRKPNIKQGQFTSDLKFNGKLSSPKIIGSFHIVETNIPFLDTTLKNISMIFKDKFIEVTSKGDVLGNEIKFKGVMQNKLSLPYVVENAELNTKTLDLNYITERIKMAQVQETNAFDALGNLDFNSLIIKRLKLNAKEIKLRNLTAEDVEAVASISDKKVFDIRNFKFKVANGTLDGKYSYDLKNNQTGLKLSASEISANDLTIALFDLNNQIYGNLTGNLDLTCNGSDFRRCMQTLNGNAKFNVSDGRMPKLGSLEYLLKAGNIIKSGVTGISVNGIIDILTPLKTGSFSDIYGILKIKDGIAEDIEITTKGKDLSLFISGKYNFSTSDAEMEVLGLLSKKISTMFGPIGNVSLNTLFNIVPGVDLSKDSKVLDKINKIPGIELSGKLFRKFIAEIKGDINGDNYVKSFRWIN